MEKNLYRDDQNHSSDPITIEKDLGKLEQKATTVLKRFLPSESQEEVIITRKEDELLKLFFAVMSMVFFLFLRIAFLF